VSESELPMTHRKERDAVETRSAGRSSDQSEGNLASRKVLAFRLSNTLTADFCVEALGEALAMFGAPEIFNTDQGSQFTSDEWTTVLDNAGVAISMDGKGRWIDNVFIERLWRFCAHNDYVTRCDETRVWAAYAQA
jgi:transposase InsO family protein